MNARTSFADEGPVRHVAIGAFIFSAINAELVEGVLEEVGEKLCLVVWLLEFCFHFIIRIVLML